MNYLSFLDGLIDLKPLSFQTGIPLSTLYKYRSGAYTPSAGRMEGLKEVYSHIQKVRLQVAGLPTREAKRLSTGSKTSVDQAIRNLNKAVSTLAKANDVEESTIRDGMRGSDKAADELWDY